MARDVGVRRSVEIAGRGTISYLDFSDSEPELVFLHGGGQNAHTWSRVIAALGRPGLSIDLPGHGHSSWRDDRDYSPITNADTIAAVLERVAPTAAMHIGMSMGGLALMHLAASRGDLVRHVVLVDILPRAKSARHSLPPDRRGATALMDGQREFATLDEMIDQAAAASPGRSRESLARGVANNAAQGEDGRWRWRYDDIRTAFLGGEEQARILWHDLSTLRVPTTLVLGGDSSFVTAADVDRFRRLAPQAHIETIPHAGHSVQGDQPLALADLIERRIIHTTTDREASR